MKFLENLNLNNIHNVVIAISTTILMGSLFLEVKLLDQKMIQLLSFMYLLIGFAQWIICTFLDHMLQNKSIMGKLILKEDALEIYQIQFVIMLLLLILPIIIYIKLFLRYE